MGSLGKNISLGLFLFIGILVITPGFAIRTHEEDPELSRHLEECHAKVTKRCAIEISDSIYTDNTCRTLAVGCGVASTLD